MRAAAEAVLIFRGEDFGVVVGADVFEGGGLAAFESLADHEGGGLDAKGIDSVVEVGGPEARLHAGHDGVLGGHDVVDLASVVAVMAAVGGAEVAGGEGPVLFGELRVYGELEEVSGGADGDEGLVRQITVECLVLEGIKVCEADGEDEEIGLG